MKKLHALLKLTLLSIPSSVYVYLNIIKKWRLHKTENGKLATRTFCYKNIKLSIMNLNNMFIFLLTQGENVCSIWEITCHR